MKNKIVIGVIILQFVAICAACYVAYDRYRAYKDSVATNNRYIAAHKFDGVKTYSEGYTDGQHHQLCWTCNTFLESEIKKYIKDKKESESGNDRFNFSKEAARQYKESILEWVKLMDEKGCVYDKKKIESLGLKSKIISEHYLVGHND